MPLNNAKHKAMDNCKHQKLKLMTPQPPKNKQTNKQKIKGIARINRNIKTT